MEEFEALREQFVARGEQFVSDLIGQPVNFSDSPEAEELIGNYQQSVQDAINTTIANFTGEATTSSTQTAAAAPSATTQDNLVATGVEQVSANLGNDSLTNPSEGSSTSDYQINFEPAAEGFGGQVNFSLNGESTPLFAFSASGTSPSATTTENPFAAQFEEFIAGFASGENSLAGA